MASSEHVRVLNAPNATRLSRSAAASGARLGLPAFAIAAVATGLWMLFGVSFADTALFAAYELAFVLLPGLLAYVALTGVARLDLRGLGVGWALGYVLEIGWFAVTAAADARGLFAVGPAVVAAVAAPRVVRVWRHTAAERREASPWRWGLAGLAAVAMVFVAEGFYSVTPLPWLVDRAYYAEDAVFPIALAAEALHHWPLTTPDLAGTALHYHYFVDLDMAAVAQVTGLRLPLVVFRLAVLPMVALVVLLLAQLALSVGRRRSAALLAPALVLFVTVFDPISTAPHWPTVDFVSSTIIYQLYTSPPFLFGTVLLLALAVELVELLRQRAGGRGTWVVVALLDAGCAGAKGPILPILLVGLAVATAYALRVDRRALRTLVGVGAVAFPIWVVAWFAIYGGSAHTTSIWPLWSARHEFGDITAYHGPILLRAGLWGLAGLVAILEATIVLLPGIAGHLLACRRRPTVAEAWLLGSFLAGVVLCYLTRAFGNDQFFFFFFGYVLAGPVAAIGLVEQWDRFGASIQRTVRGLAPRPALYASAAVLVATVLVVDTPWRDPGRIAGSRSGVAVRYAAGSPNAYMQVGADLYRGLTWLRDHTSVDAVFAVNNLYLDQQATAPRACYYTAFTERRAMLSCEYGVTAPDGAKIYAPSSIYPPLALAIRDPTSHPFADRFELVRAIFQRGDRGAVREAASRFGVRYLLVDLSHGGTAGMVTRLERTAHVVFRNPSLVVLSVGRA